MLPITARNELFSRCNLFSLNDTMQTIQMHEEYRVSMENCNNFQRKKRLDYEIYCFLVHNARITFKGQSIKLTLRFLAQHQNFRLMDDFCFCYSHLLDKWIRDNEKAISISD